LVSWHFMKNLVFFEKPGCATNARQQQVLRNAGVAFEARSLLTEPWTRARLLQFFAGLPVAQWFNRAAPRVKSGDVNPDQLDAETALALMLAEPLLIRRPLLQTDDWFAVGFDWETLALQIGVAADAAAAAAQMTRGVLDGCSHGEHAEAARCATAVADADADADADESAT
jgi:nitrogenase-associated protein